MAGLTGNIHIATMDTGSGGIIDRTNGHTIEIEIGVKINTGPKLNGLARSIAAARAGPERARQSVRRTDRKGGPESPHAAVTMELLCQYLKTHLPLKPARAP